MFGFAWETAFLLTQLVIWVSLFTGHFGDVLAASSRFEEELTLLSRMIDGLRETLVSIGDAIARFWHPVPLSRLPTGHQVVNPSGASTIR